MYVDPPTAHEVDQGIIVDRVFFYALDEERPGFILTPTCDFEQKKVDYVHVCAVEHAEAVLRGFLAGPYKRSFSHQDGSPLTAPLSTGKKNELVDIIQRLIRQRYGRWHWLAPMPGTSQPLVVDFQLVQSASVPELEQATIVAQLASPFREQVPARYVAYMGRVGTPDFPQADTTTWVNRLIDVLFPPARI